MINYSKIILGILLISSVCLQGCGGGDKTKDNKSQTDVAVLVTSADKKYDLASDSVNFSKNETQGSPTLILNPSVEYQTIDGFGAAVTGSSAYNMSLMPEDKRKAFIEETFSPDKYGFSYVRVPIGCSDFSLSEYSCCDTKGIENFALTDEENKYIIPALKQILAVNPDLKIMGTPWTCPQWMKVKTLEGREPFMSWTSGHLNPDYYQDYAQYFVKWIQAFNQEGIKIYCVTPQNEPLNRGNSASLYMGWEEERDFVKTALGPSLKNAGLGSVKIYAFDHNYNYDNMESQKQYPLKIYEDAEAARYFTGAAYHNYGGDRSELINIHNARPDKELIFSEASIGEWNKGRDLKASLLRDMEELSLGTVNNWCRAVILWNLMLDTNQGPYGSEGACRTCYGAVDIDNETYSKITRNSHYYVMAHMASVVKPGATKIKVDGFTRDGLTYAAFRNTDNSYALVLSNNHSETLNLTVKEEKNEFTYMIPAFSIVSYRWKK